MKEVPTLGDQLAIYKGEIEKPSQAKGTDVCRGSVEDVDADQLSTNSQSESQKEDTVSQASSRATLNSDSGSKSCAPLIMGNNTSAEIGSAGMGSAESVERKSASTPSRLNRVRAALRNSVNRKSSKSDDKKRRHSEDKANNNGTVMDKPNGLHYTDNITRSSTLPNHIHRINGTTGNIKTEGPGQARLLPAYKSEQSGIIGNIQNRQRMLSTPSHTGRTRNDSQSSAYSQRYHTVNRVTTTHIPAHLDKRLIRSKSVGIIPDAELRMRRTASASVVKLADCEDWVV